MVGISPFDFTGEWLSNAVGKFSFRQDGKKVVLEKPHHEYNGIHGVVVGRAIIFEKKGFRCVLNCDGLFDGIISSFGDMARRLEPPVY